MIHLYRVFGDCFHASSILLFLVIVGIKGNGSGVSIKTHQLFFCVFLMRYLDLFTTFYSLYNTLMKVFFIVATLSVILLVLKKEPAKSTYSATQDAMNQWNLLIAAGMCGMVVHLVGSGVVDIKGSSGQEFEVHLEHYSWQSFLWTFSICLEPLAMLPQLYIFRKNRLINRTVKVAILFMGLYRLCYVIFWVFRAYKEVDYKHHILLYISGTIQCLTYTDFCFYHWSVSMLWFLSKYGGLSGDSSSMVHDSGIEGWALKASGRDVDEYRDDPDEEEEGWAPGDKPASKTFEMKKISGLRVI